MALAFGRFVLDEPGRALLLDGRERTLQPLVFDLLVYLASHPNQVFTRAQLLRDVWEYEVPIDTRTVDVHVRWLRQKLEESGGQVPEIETARRVGYRLTMSALPMSA